MPRRKSHRQELTERKEQIEAKIEAAEKKLLNRTIDSQWLEEHRRINHLRVTLNAVTNRLNNLGKKHSGIMETSINFNYYKSGLL